MPDGLRQVGVQFVLKDYQKFAQGLQGAEKQTRNFTTALTKSMNEAAKAAQATKITDAFKQMQKQIAAFATSAELKRGAGFPEFVTQIEQQAERLQQVTGRRLQAFAQGVGKLRFANMELARRDFIKFFEETGVATQVWGKEQEVAKEQTDEFGKSLWELAQAGGALPGVFGQMSSQLARFGTELASTTGGAALVGAGVGAAFGGIGTAITTAITSAIGSAIFPGIGTAIGAALGVALSKAVSAAMNAIASAVSLGIGALKELATAAMQVSSTFVRSMAQIGKSAIEQSGRFVEIELATIAMGRAFGMTDGQVRAAIKSVNDMNIRYDAAAESVSDMIRTQLDLSYATDLVRIAQALAIRTGRESSEEMRYLTWALTTNNTQMLRRHGIIIEAEVAERRFAEANDLAVESLTRRQKIEAQVQEAIRQSAHLQGVYTAAMQSGAKMMRSIESRLIPELLAAIGMPFQGAFSTITKAVYDFLEALNASLGLGGRFEETMIRIGAVAQIAAEEIVGVFDTLMEVISRPIEVERLTSQLEKAGIVPAEAIGRIKDDLDTAGKEINNWIADLAISAFEWGATIMEQLARGLASGLNFVAEAMLALAQVLTFWMGAFSAPRVAPDIAKWGAAAMAEYLRGFTKVDFSAFREIQNVLGRLFQGPELASFLGELVETMATGDMSSKFFDMLSRRAGAYAAEITKLVRLEFDLAAALRAVEAAQKALNRANEAVMGHRKEVDRLVREYNRMLKAGASDAVLDTKLKEINASERARNAAVIERDEKQEALKVAQAAVDPIQEQIDLQRALVDVLLDIAAAQADVEEATKKAAKAAKGAAKDIAEEFEDLGIGAGAGFGEGFMTEMQKRIDEIKEQVKARLKDIFAPLREAWFGRPEVTGMLEIAPGVEIPQIEMVGVVPAFEKMLGAWEELKGVLETIGWDKIGELAKAISEAPWNLLIDAINAVSKWMPTLVKRVEILVGILRRLGLLPEPGGGGGGGGRGGADGGGLPTKEAPIGVQLAAGIPSFGGIWQPIVESFAGLIEPIKTAFADADWKGVGMTILNSFLTAIGGASPATMMFPIGVSIVEGIDAGIRDDLTPLYDAMQYVADQMLVFASDKESQLGKTLQNVGKAFNIMIGKGIRGNVNLLINAMDQAMRRAKEHIAQNIPQAPAPPPGFPGGGGRGPDIGRQQGGYEAYGGIRQLHAGEYTMPAPIVRALMQAPSQTINNVQIGPQNVSSAIDQAGLIGLIRYQIQKELTRA